MVVLILILKIVLLKTIINIVISVAFYRRIDTMLQNADKSSAIKIFIDFIVSWINAGVFLKL